MELKLSCYCCGKTDFESNELYGYEIEGSYYVYPYETEKEKLIVKCKNCGLEDYVFNLVPKFSLIR